MGPGPAGARGRLQAKLAYPEDTVGALMDYDMVTIREDRSIEVVLRYLCRYDEIPAQTDTLFAVDRDNVLRGLLPIKRHLVSDASIEKIVALSVLMTVIRSMSGNASIQTMAHW